MTLNTFQQWQVTNGHHVTENIDGDEFHAPELCPLCQDLPRRTVLLDADHSAYDCTRMGCDQPVTTVYIMHTAGIYGACDEHFEPAPEDSGRDDAMTSSQAALRRRTGRS